jgi:hypothetical protein
METDMTPYVWYNTCSHLQADTEILKQANFMPGTLHLQSLKKNAVDKSDSQTNEILALKCMTNKYQTFCDGSSLISYKFHFKLNVMQFTVNFVWFVK